MATSAASAELILRDIFDLLATNRSAKPALARVERCDPHLPNALKQKRYRYDDHFGGAHSYGTRSFGMT